MHDPRPVAMRCDPPRKVIRLESEARTLRWARATSTGYCAKGVLSSTMSTMGKAKTTRSAKTTGKKTVGAKSAAAKAGGAAQAKKMPAKKTSAAKAAAKKTPAKKAAPAKAAAAAKKPLAKKATAAKGAKAQAKGKPAKKPVAKKAAPKTAAAKSPARPPRATNAASGVESHPSFGRLTAALAPGRYASGLLLVTEPGALDEEMSAWMLGKTQGRRSLGRTAFGDFVIFRDLRERAEALGMPGAERACDVALLDVHYKRMQMLADSVESFLSSLDRDEWQEEFLRAGLYSEAKTRIGDYEDNECFYFVPALALGGAEEPDAVERGDWRVHQAILIQT
jgi:hypothetical protein